MNPIKFFHPISTWLMRIGIVLFALVNYFYVLQALNMRSIVFYIAFVSILFSVLLFVGGFFRKPTLTIVSSIFLILVAGYQIFTFLPIGLTNNFAICLLTGAIAFYFLANGNK
ncbi:MAG: hypothetical protein KAG99_02985 [Bacteroidales bacterium]|nr:hypothetical protein [Bacteroidales bacterium]